MKVVKHIVATQFRSSAKSVSRIAVTRDGDFISIAHIGGRAPYLRARLLDAAIVSVFGEDYEYDDLSHKETKVTCRVGMSGCADYSIIARQDDATLDYPTLARLHESSEGKLSEGLPRTWIDHVWRFHNMLQFNESIDLQREGDGDTYEVYVPRTWDEIPEFSPKYRSDAERDLMKKFFEINPRTYYNFDAPADRAYSAWSKPNGGFEAAVAAFKAAGGILTDKTIETLYETVSAYPEKDLEDYYKGNVNNLLNEIKYIY